MIANELVGKYLARLGMYVLTLPAWVAWVGFYLCFFVLGVMVDAARLGLRDGPDMMAWVFDEKRSA